MSQFNTMKEFKNLATDEDYKVLQEACFLTRPTEWNRLSNTYGFNKKIALKILNEAGLTGSEWSLLRRELRLKNGYYKNEPKPYVPIEEREESPETAVEIIATVKADIKNHYYMLVKLSDDTYAYGISSSAAYSSYEFTIYKKGTKNKVLQDCVYFRSVLKEQYHQCAELYLQERRKHCILTLQHLTERIKAFSIFIDLLKAL